MIKQLARESVLTIQPYEPGKPIEEVARELGMPEPDIIKMASNENPLGMSPAARKAMLEHLDAVFQYPESSCPPLRQALAEKHGVEPGQIIVGNGADGVIWYLGMSLIAEGDEAVIPAATFPLYETIVNAMRGRVVTSRMEGYSLDLKDILRKVSPLTKMVWLCNPNNPTGTLVEARRFRQFFEELPPSVLLVHDEVYRDFAPEKRFPDTLSMVREGRANLMLLRSFSKIYGLAGLRVGYGIGPAGLIDLMYKTRPPFDVSALAQAAALGALNDSGFVAETLALTNAGKAYLRSQCERLGLRYAPSSTNFLLLDTGMDSARVCRELESRGIIVRPADRYGYPNHIRVTIGTMENNQRFIRALEELITAKEKHPR